MRLNEGTQVNGSVGDQNYDALAIQEETVIDMSFDHLGSGNLTSARVESHTHRKLFPEGKSQRLVLGVKAENEFPVVLGEDLQLDSDFFTSWIDEGGFCQSCNWIEGH